MVYYRYVYFMEDGRCLYALTPTAPHDMFKRFLKMCCGPSAKPGSHSTASTSEDCVVWGTYELRKHKVIVDAKQPWQFVRLELSIQPHITLNGRFGYLSFDRHMTSTLPLSPYGSAVRDENVITYDVPDEPFRFIPCKNL
jgi:hypothetical protein